MLDEIAIRTGIAVRCSEKYLCPEWGFGKHKTEAWRRILAAIERRPDLFVKRRTMGPGYRSFWLRKEWEEEHGPEGGV